MSQKWKWPILVGLFFFYFVNLLIKINIFCVALVIISVFLHSHKRCRCVIWWCVIPHGLLFMLLFAHIKLKPWKGKKALFVGLGKSKLTKCCNYTILRNSLCCTQFRLTQKPAYTSSDLTWDLIVATAHVHTDKFQVLCRNDRTPNFRSYVRFVNEAQYERTLLFQCLGLYNWFEKKKNTFTLQRTYSNDQKWQ